MKFKKWIAAFIGGLILSTSIIAGLNYLIDPFGVFGDKLMKWDEYNIVNNPRVAKIGYLDRNHEKYDSYLLGGSKSSSISPTKLNEYYGDASFYSLLMYGGDFHDYEKQMRYVIDNFEVKNIVLHISLQEIGHYNETPTDFKQSLHAKVLDESLLKFYTKYLFLNPTYSLDKIQGKAENKIDPMAYSSINVETGVYNKTVRDQEDVTDLDTFWANNPNFELPVAPYSSEAMDKNVATLKRMKEYAEANGATFRVITGATYLTELNRYNLEDVKVYWKKLAEVTDFWDFTGYTSVTDNPRYYYDNFHYRNSVGDMMLGYVFNDPDVYVPDNFGHYTTIENVEEHAEKVFTNPYTFINGESVNVPIVVYHHISEDKARHNTLTISPEKFESDLVAIKEAGYTTVTFKDLENYVNEGTPLPEKPIVLTFDDGYLSNYDYAYPLLQKYNMKATIFMIGWSTGRTTHRIEGAKFDPHFTYEQAKEMYDSGLVDLHNHSYDMHEGETAERYGALPKADENTAQYEQAFKSDLLKNDQLIEENIGNEVFAFSYPYGKYTVQSEQMLKDIGYTVSLTVKEGINVIKRGDATTLYGLKRINSGSDLSSAGLIERIK